jgi:hypothetical protein
LGGAAALSAFSAGAYLHFHQTVAGNSERGDRIDYSSLATVVSIDTYSQEQALGSSPGIKGHKMLVDLPPSFPTPVATTAVKTNFGQVTGTATKVSALVAENAGRLQRHLEYGLASGRVREKIVIAANSALSSGQSSLSRSGPLH